MNSQGLAQPNIKGFTGLKYLHSRFETPLSSSGFTLKRAFVRKPLMGSMTC